MNKEFNHIINKLISGNRLAEDELSCLDDLLNNLSYRHELNEFLEKKWTQSESTEVKLKFDQIKNKIKVSPFKVKVNRLFIVLSKAAAVLFIPILAAVLYFFINQPISSNEMVTLSTEKGEITNVVLPDGSNIWLNVDSRLSYPVNYGIKSRSLELSGEAYFDVAENKELPFEVKAGDLITKALGTRFVISAYPEAEVIKSSLIEGSVKVSFNNDLKILEPGQQAVVDKEVNTFTMQLFNEDYETSWKNEHLIFRFTPFDQVVTKIEKWYNVKIEYNPDQFESETLTVRFSKHETLEHVLEVLSKANDFTYTINEENVIIVKDNSDENR